MSVYNDSILIRNLRQLMKDNGVSQSQLATDICSNQSSISKCLNGNKTITLDFAYRIAHRFNVTIDYLCVDHSEEPVTATHDEKEELFIPPTQTLIKVCTALATLFKTFTLRTGEISRREEVYTEIYDDYGNPTGQFFRKQNQNHEDPVNRYISVFFPNYSEIQNSFNSQTEADEYYSLLHEYGNELEPNYQINDFLRKLKDLQDVYLKNSMSTESYHKAIDDNLAALTQTLR